MALKISNKQMQETQQQANTAIATMFLLNQKIDTRLASNSEDLFSDSKIFLRRLVQPIVICQYFHSSWIASRADRLALQRTNIEDSKGEKRSVIVEAPARWFWHEETRAIAKTLLSKTNSLEVLFADTLRAVHTEFELQKKLNPLSVKSLRVLDPPEIATRLNYIKSVESNYWLSVYPQTLHNRDVQKQAEDLIRISANERLNFITVWQKYHQAVLNKKRIRAIEFEKMAEVRGSEVAPDFLNQMRQDIYVLRNAVMSNHEEVSI